MLLSLNLGGMLLKPEIKCPCCGSDKMHTYRVPGHPELEGKEVEIMSMKYEGVTIARLVTCEDCGNVYDSVVAKKII